MYDDSREARRAWRAQRRYERRYYRYSNPLRGLAGGIFIIALIIGFSLNNAWHGTGFLVMLFIGLACCSFFGSISSLNPRAIYGGIQGAVWMLGLALCFIIGFWPWILLPVAVTMILGALISPITAGLAGWSFLAASQGQQPQQPYQQPVYQPPQGQPDPQSYQQGYQGAPQPIYQEGGQHYPLPKQEYEQPQTHYPEQQQELPPMEQQ
jgi:ABC-type multidrug transport system permease subunit